MAQKYGELNYFVSLAKNMILFLLVITLVTSAQIHLQIPSKSSFSTTSMEIQQVVNPQMLGIPGSNVNSQAQENYFGTSSESEEEKNQESKEAENQYQHTNYPGNLQLSSTHESRMLQSSNIDSNIVNTGISDQKTTLIQALNLQFSDIGLYQKLPIVLTQGQTIQVRGRILNEIAEAFSGLNTFIFMIFQDSVTSFRCFSFIDSSKEFDINCKILKVGNFKILFEVLDFVRESKILRTVLNVQQNPIMDQNLQNSVQQNIIANQTPQTSSDSVVEKRVTVQVINGMTVETTVIATTTGGVKKTQTSRKILSSTPSAQTTQISTAATPPINFQSQMSQSGNLSLSATGAFSQKVSVKNVGNIRLTVEDNFLYLRWSFSQTNSSLRAKIFIKQGNEVVQLQELLNKQFLKFNPIDFRQFLENTKTRLEFSIDGVQEQPFVIEFLAVQHKFQLVRNTQNVNIQPLPYRITLGGNLTVRGTFQQSMRNMVLIETPMSEFIQYPLSPSVASDDFVRPNIPISVSIKFDEEGAYLLQINRASGRALVNRPVYVGNAYPLTPDFSDLSIWAIQSRRPPLPYYEQYVGKKLGTQFKESAAQSPDSVKIRYLVDLTNALRQKFGKNSLSIDPQLNRLSLLHAQDMVLNNFTGHINLQGESPSDRADKLNITRNVGQNLATAYSLTQNFLNLWRSSAHFRNSLNEEWTDVGAGIVKKSNNLVYVVMNFANRDIVKNPLTSTEINNIRMELAEFVKEMNPALKSYDPNLSEIITRWMKQGEQGNVFDTVYQAGYRSGLSGTSWSMTYKRNIVQDFKSARGFPKNMPQFSKFGVGINTVSQKIQFYFIFVV